MAAFRAFWNSPMGPKTTHFWGPVANGGFVVAGLLDTQKPPELISGNMTAAMCVYSGLFMRFAWVIRPRNYLLLACHASNETVQLYQLSRWGKAQGASPASAPMGLQRTLVARITETDTLKHQTGELTKHGGKIPILFSNAYCVEPTTIRFYWQGIPLIALTAQRL